MPSMSAACRGLGKSPSARCRQRRRGHWAGHNLRETVECAAHAEIVLSRRLSNKKKWHFRTRHFTSRPGPAHVRGCRHQRPHRACRLRRADPKRVRWVASIYPAAPITTTAPDRGVLAGICALMRIFPVPRQKKSVPAESDDKNLYILPRRALRRGLLLPLLPGGKALPKPSQRYNRTNVYREEAHGRQITTANNAYCHRRREPWGLRLRRFSRSSLSVHASEERASSGRKAASSSPSIRPVRA